MDRRHGEDVGPTGLAQMARRAAPAKTGQRLHDVIDLASGRSETTSLARSPTATARAKGLTRLGFGAHASIFGSPTHRLSPQKPYQPTPEAWLDAYDGTYNAGPGVDQIWWRLPASFATEFMPGCNFLFRGVPAGAAVLSLSFEAWPHQGRMGKVVVDIGAQRTEIAVSTAATRSVDIGFTHNGAASLRAMVFFRPGIYDFAFRSVTLGSGPIVMDPLPVLASRARRATR